MLDLYLDMNMPSLSTNYAQIVPHGEQKSCGISATKGGMNSTPPGAHDYMGFSSMVWSWISSSFALSKIISFRVSPTTS